MNDVYDFIDSILTERQWSRRKLALLAGIPQSTMSMMFKRHSPNPLPYERVLQISDALRMSPKEFLVYDPAFSAILTPEQKMDVSLKTGLDLHTIEILAIHGSKLRKAIDFMLTSNGFMSLLHLIERQLANSQTLGAIADKEILNWEYFCFQCQKRLNIALDELFDTFDGAATLTSLEEDLYEKSEEEEFERYLDRLESGDYDAGDD